MDTERVKDRVWNAQAAVGVVLIIVGLGLIVSPIAQAGVLSGSGAPTYECGPSMNVQQQSLSVGASSSLQQQSTNNATLVVGVSANGDGKVVAHDAGSGEELWNFSTNDYTSSSPTVSDGTVYIGDSAGDEPNGSVHALDLETGAVEWTYNTTDGGFYSSPAVTDGYVFMALDSGDGVIALDADTGSLEWKSDTRSFSRMYDSGSIKNGTVYFDGEGSGGNDGGVVGYNATTGVEEFWYRTQDNRQSTSTVRNGVLYDNDGGESNLVAVNVQTGSELWTFEGVFLSAPPVVDDGDLYFSSQKRVQKLDSNGNPIWKFKDEPGVFGNITFSGGVTTTDNLVIVGTEGYGDTTHVYGINKTTGAKVWNTTYNKTQLPMPDAGAQGVQSVPTVHNGVVYLTTTTSGTDDNGYLLALNASTGEKLYNKSIGATESSPTIVPPSSQGYSDGSRINEETLGMHGGIPICTGLWVDTDEYLPHNNSSKFVVRAYDSGTEQWENVTGDPDLSVNVSQPSVVDVYLNNATITSTKDRTVNERVTVTATLDNFEGEQQVTVANETIAQYDILPPMQMFSSAIGDDNTLIVLIATGAGAGVAVFATSLAGLGAFALVIIGGWLGGFAGDHIVISALLVTLFVGLNVSQLVEFDRR